MDDDNHLVTRAQGGDRQAFAALYDRHVDAIYRYALLRTPSPELAEDLTEDVFLRALQSLSRYRPDQPFRHWLYRIAHNRAVDEIRRYDQRNTSLEALDEQGWQVAGHGPSPLQAAITAEDVRTVREALTTMSAEEQTVLTLRFVDDMAYQDVAPILGKSEGACRVLLHRALKKLADKLTVTGGVTP
jgi:RNA polymerase sigma-70 factor (ECF subfamily)